MKYISFRKTLLLVCVFSLLSPELLLAKDFKDKASQSTINTEKIDLKDLALPSEVEGIKKESGAIFYSPASKGKVLIPVNFWGEISKSGLHYVPVETDLVKGLSLAGGPKSSGKLENIKLTRKEGDELKEFKFDLSEGGTTEAYAMKLEPGDTIYVDKSYFYENRAYYTSRVGLALTIVSTIFLTREVRKK